MNGHRFHTGNEDADERLNSYADPAEIDKIIREAAAQWDLGKDLHDSRARISAYFNTHGRMIFVPGQGWIDLMHVAAAYSSAKKYGPGFAWFLGFGVEVGEGVGLFGTQSIGSAYQVEDFRSNNLGIDMVILDRNAKTILQQVTGNVKIPNQNEAGQLGTAELMNPSHEGRLEDVVWYNTVTLPTLKAVANNPAFVKVLVDFAPIVLDAFSTTCPSAGPPGVSTNVSGTILK